MDRMDFSFSFKKKPEGAGPAKANPFAVLASLKQKG